MPGLSSSQGSSSGSSSSSGSPPVDGCWGPPAGDLRTFSQCPNGGGVFGQWVVDGYGMPAFRYTMDERTDVRAVWRDQLNAQRRDHFIMMGNRRVNFMATNEGYVQLFSNDRAPTWLNRFHEGQMNLGGGFSYVAEGGQVFATAHRYAPMGASFERLFGSGYVEQAITHQGLRVVHRIFAPFGDDALLLDDVEIENLEDRPRTLTHHEYWDVNRHQLLLEWLRVGVGVTPSDNGRDAFNGNFTQQVTYDATSKVLTAVMNVAAGQNPPLPTANHREDWYPPPVFLAALSGEVDAVWGDQDAFFGAGPPALPAAVVTPPAQGALLPQTNAQLQPAALVMRTPLGLAARQTVKLRFAYGYLPAGKTLAMLDAYRAPSQDVLRESMTSWRNQLAYVDVPGMPLLHRETAWRTHQLLQHTVTNQAFGTSYTAQGSAYLYLHGADGVPRDQALYAAPITFLDPQLAKGNLRQIMAVTDATTGQIWYSFSGVGMVDGASPIHMTPSDIDVFFLWGLFEYLAATGDLAFLQQTVPFYPAGGGRPSVVTGDTVLDHVRVAVWHLRDVVGRGEHGLIKIKDGDWSDGICVEDPSPLAISNTYARGESVPNSQMALYALPRLAPLLAPLDATTAAAMTQLASELETPVREAFGTRWFSRAWLANTINQLYEKGNDRASDGFNANYLDLEAQPWGVLADVLTPQERNTLLDDVQLLLDEPSALGPQLRSRGNTMVWPAISQLMTWAYARHRPAAAWQSMREHLYTTHANTFPTQWAGIWSAADGMYASPAEENGGAWTSPVTPMDDFPVANMNQEAMWFWGLLKTLGVETVAEGIRVVPAADPAVPRYAFQSPLLELRVEPGRVEVTYHAFNAGTRELQVQLPAHATPQVELDGAVVAVTPVNGLVRVPLVLVAGTAARLVVTWP